jgi:CRP-like cAMP-binding protein
MTSLFINLTDPVIFQSFGGDEYWTTENVAAGSSILKEGDDSEDFYYIFSGLVKITKSIKDEGGTQKHLATLGAGDFFGEGALLSDKGRGATVEAVEDSKLLKLSQAKFEALVTKDPQAAVGIILGIVKVLNARLQGMNERLVMLEHVTDLTRKLKGNLAEVLPSVLKELEVVLHHKMLLLFSAKGEVRYTTSTISPDALQAFSASVQNLLTQFAQPNAPLSLIEGEHLYAAVHNLQGELKGMLACQVCAECQDADLKLFLTVAEQIGNLL